MENRLLLLQVLIAFICLYCFGCNYMNAADIPNNHIMNTKIVNSSIELVQPVSSSNCTVNIMIKGLTDRSLAVMKLPNDVRMKVSLVDSQGKLCPLTDDGEKYYGEKDVDPNWITSSLVWLKKDEPIFIKIDLAKYFQLKAGHWILKMSIPLAETKKEGKPRPEAVSVQFENVKIEISD